MSYTCLGTPPTKPQRLLPFRQLFRFSAVIAATLFVTALAIASARASSIYGTLSNFDIYNTTPEPCEGAEIELEGIRSSDIGGDYPANFANRTIEEYFDASNQFAGTRIRYTGYNFPGAPVPGSLMPNPNPVSTNGHELVYTAGGEHFGFWLAGAQPTATRFFWLNNNAGNYERIGNLPETVPGPTWNYLPPANPGQPPVLQAVVRVPAPEVDVDQKPDSTWVKVFKTKVEEAPGNLQDLLEKLISGDPNDSNYANLVPQGEVEIETEWELLEGGKNPKEKIDEDPLEDNDKIVIRRYEFYKYIGAVDEENEPLSLWETLGNPEDPGVDVLDDQGNVIFAAERGDFIAANMVAAVLVPPVPEPTTLLLGLLGIGTVTVVGRPRARTMPDGVR
ncbi:MAG: PEP-CTERM sorting domain-containing protein [Pirellulales bacterium]